jgi:stress response protein SCP2
VGNTATDNNSIKYCTQDIFVSLKWISSDPWKVDLDLAAFMLNKEGKLPSDDYLVFFNNLRSPDSAVELTGDDLSVKKGTTKNAELIRINLLKVEEKIVEIVFVATIGNLIQGVNFSHAKDSTVMITNALSLEPIANYTLEEDFSGETAVEFCKLYRTPDGSWDFMSIGNGYYGYLQFFGGKYDYRNIKSLLKAAPSNVCIDEIFEADNNRNEELQSENEVDLKKRDPMFEEAARLVVQHQQGSTSLVQRRLSIGYNRAGSIIDQLEAAGIIGPYEGSKARDVLVQDQNVLERILKNLDN